jgi:pyruvate/2-oxoglutarate/acetoin dehydrogenase E1 component
MNAPIETAVQGTVQTLTYAQAAQQALEQAMDRDPRVVALGEDLGRGGVFGQYRGLQQRFGPRA